MIPRGRSQLREQGLQTQHCTVPRCCLAAPSPPQLLSSSAPGENGKQTQTAHPFSFPSLCLLEVAPAALGAFRMQQRGMELFPLYSPLLPFCSLLLRLLPSPMHEVAQNSAPHRALSTSRASSDQRKSAQERHREPQSRTLKGDVTTFSSSELWDELFRHASSSSAELLRGIWVWRLMKQKQTELSTVLNSPERKLGPFFLIIPPILSTKSKH